MLFPSTKNKTKFLQKRTRNKQGAVLAVVLFSIFIVFAFLALALDVMREFLAVQQMKHAARAAALHIMPFASLDANGQGQNQPICDTNGNINSISFARMIAELNTVNGSSGEAWNSMLNIDLTSTNQDVNSSITFDASDVLSAASGTGIIDKNELVLQLTVKKEEQSAFKFLFLPVIFALSQFNGSGANFSDLAQTNLSQKVEILAQPATRIGSAPPLSLNSGRAAAYVQGRLATFPLAINFSDFNSFQQRMSGSRTCQLRISDPSASSLSDPSILRAYFVNIRSGGNVSGYYFDAQSQTSTDDLLGLINYFLNSSNSLTQTPINPGACERGINLDRFSIPSLSAINSQLNQALTLLPTAKCYILPVVAEGTSPQSQCQVIGFAWLRLDSFAINGTNMDLSFTIAESLPVLNASTCPKGTRSLPRFDGTKSAPLLVSDLGPFKSRTFDPANNSFSARPFGVVLAPSISPRLLR